MLREAVALTQSASEALYRRVWLYVLLRIEVAAADFDAVEGLRQQIAELPGYDGDLEVRGDVMLSRAAEAFHRDGATASLQSLGAMIEQLPFGRAQACARIDAAWLHLEDGSITRAEQLLSGLGAWRHEHPAGLAVDARLQFALGRPGEAVALQQRSLSMFRSAAPACHEDLLKAYQHACETRTAPALQRLPRLLSTSWLPALL